MRQLISIYCAMFLLGAATDSDAEGRTVQIKFIPFEMHTYFPVTKQVIAESYGYFGEVEIDNIEIAKIEFLLDNALYGNLDENRIRVELKYPDGKVVYVDANGGAEIGLRQRRLSSINRNRMNQLLKNLTTEKTWQNNSDGLILP